MRAFLYTGHACSLCAVIGQAAHWFDHEKSYPEIHRVLRPNGVLAYIGYGIFYLPKHPKLSPLIHNFVLNTLSTLQSSVHSERR